MSGKGSSKFMPEATTRSDILYLFGQGNCIFCREKSGILISDVCGDHEVVLKSSVFIPECTRCKHYRCRKMAFECQWHKALGNLGHAATPPPRKRLKF